MSGTMQAAGAPAGRAGTGNGLERRADGVLAVSGALTFQTVPDIHERANAWVRAPNGTVAVDLSGVTRADSAGLALLLEWLRLAAGGGRELRFVNVPDQVHRLIEINGLTEILPGG
jgi:phospholipid transport system transporter-binding protein